MQDAHHVLHLIGQRRPLAIERTINLMRLQDSIWLPTAFHARVLLYALFFTYFDYKVYRYRPILEEPPECDADWS